MVEINLLPWREYKQRYERKMMRRYVTASLVVALIVLFSVHEFLGVKVRHQERRIHHLRASLPVVTEADAASGKAGEYLSVASIIAMLNVAAASTDSGVCYHRIARDASELQLVGNALSPQSIASGLRVLEASSLFYNVQLSDLKKDAMHHDMQFVLHTRALKDDRGE